MIQPNELRIGNTILNEDKIKTLDEDFLEVLFATRNYKQLNPIELTPEILKCNLGFKVFDMGDFWQCEKADFVLIQMKITYIKLNLPFQFMINSSLKGSINFYYVHHLQNVYYALTKKELKWKH